MDHLTRLGLRRLVEVVAVALTAIAILAAGPGPSFGEPRSEEFDFFTRTNQLRASKGLVPLVTDSQLTDVARVWSAQMAAAGDLSHNLNLPNQVTNWRLLGENVGEDPSVASVQAAFEASPEHYDHIVNPAYRAVGIGVVDSGGTIWVTVAFKQPATVLAAPALSAAVPPTSTTVPPDAPDAALGAPPIVGHVALPADAKTAPLTPTAEGGLARPRADVTAGPRSEPKAPRSLRGLVQGASAVLVLGVTIAWFWRRRSRRLKYRLP